MGPIDAVAGRSSRFVRRRLPFVARSGDAWKYATLQLKRCANYYGLVPRFWRERHPSEEAEGGPEDEGVAKGWVSAGVEDASMQQGPPVYRDSAAQTKFQVERAPRSVGRGCRV